jgi:serine/threonine protein kinase
LLARYFDLRSRGETVALEELCRDTPELLADLRREIAARESAGSTVENPRTADRRDTTVNHAADLAHPCGPVVGGYELLGELGRGSMGAVFRARQVSLNRLVALKLVAGRGFESAEGRARFRAEATIVARLRHPNIVQIFEFCPRDDDLYFSMELCEGGSLKQRLRSGPLAPREAATLMRAVAEGAQAAHDQGIIHRDLSPGNILLALRSGESPEGERSPAATAEGSRPLADCIPKISDFGLAKQANVDLTCTGMTLGTPCYMAPEQTVDARAIDHRADVYALGAILYESLTGQPPFQTEAMHDLLDQVRRCEPVPVRQLQPTVPRDLETICLKCLSKEPARRYATARELADDLGRFLASEPIRARPSGPLERLARWAQRPERVPFAGRVAIVLYGALAAWKLLALTLIALGIGIFPRNVGECLVQGLSMVALANLPQIGIGLATLARWPPAPRIGVILSLCYLIFVSVCLSTSVLTFGGLLEEPNIRGLFWCLLIVPGSITLLAYLVAIIAQRAGRHSHRY